MESIYVCVAILFSIIIIVSNHMDNKILCNIGGIGMIVASLLYVLWKNNKKKR